MSDAKPASRRRRDAELKRQIIAACAAPGGSVAQVAMSYGRNVNLVHKWRRLASDDGEIRSSAAFVPVSIVEEVPPSDPPQSIELGLQRGAVHVRMRCDGNALHGWNQLAQQHSGLILLNAIG
jgi:transposase